MQFELEMAVALLLSSHGYKLMWFSSQPVLPGITLGAEMLILVLVPLIHPR